MNVRGSGSIEYKRINVSFYNTVSLKTRTVLFSIWPLADQGIKKKYLKTRAAQNKAEVGVSAAAFNTKDSITPFKFL